MRAEINRIENASNRKHIRQEEQRWGLCDFRIIHSYGNQNHMAVQESRCAAPWKESGIKKQTTQIWSTDASCWCQEQCGEDVQRAGQPQQEDVVDPLSRDTEKGNQNGH